MLAGWLASSCRGHKSARVTGGDGWCSWLERSSVTSSWSRILQEQTSKTYQSYSAGLDRPLYCCSPDSCSWMTIDLSGRWEFRRPKQRRRDERLGRYASRPGAVHEESERKRQLDSAIIWIRWECLHAAKGVSRNSMAYDLYWLDIWLVCNRREV